MTATKTAAKTNKKTAITQAIQALGDDATAQAVVEHVKKTTGLSVSAIYVYSIRKGDHAGDGAIVPTEALSVARRLIREAGSRKVAIAAVRQVSEEEKATNHAVSAFENQIRVLRAKTPANPAEREEVQAQIKSLSDRANQIRKMVG